MDSIALAACFNLDPRATCLLDTDLSADDAGQLASVRFRNQALQVQTHLLDDLLDATTPTGLRAWAHDRSFCGLVAPTPGLSIYTYVIDGRWRVVQWNPATDRKRSSITELDSVLAAHHNATRKLDNLHRMMEDVNVGMFEYNQQGKLVWGNDAFYRLSGQATGDAKEEISWGDGVYPEDHERLLEQWKRLASGAPLNLEVRLQRPATSMPEGRVEDTKGRWVLATCVPIFDQDGVVTSVSGCLTDIDAQKQSQLDASQKKAEALERLNASEKRFSNFAQSTDVGIWLTDVDYKLQWMNQGWFTITGHPMAPVENIDWSTLMDDDNLKLVQGQLEEGVRTKGLVQFELELSRIWRNDQGDEMPTKTLCAVFPELDDNGTITGFAGTVTDITHLRWAEKVQMQRTEEAIETKRQQENFIDMTCHEIRNPLGAVVHCVELVPSSLTEIYDEVKRIVTKKSQLDTVHELFASTFECVETITSCCAHQKRIVDDILTLSKLDSKLLTIALAPVKLDGLLTEISRMFEADAQKVGVELRIVRDPSIDRMIANRQVVVDSGRLMQVLINLITNSLKFTQQQEGEKSIAVTIAASREKPTEETLGVEFVPATQDRYAGSRRSSPTSPILDQSNGSRGGDDFFLYFKVTDTGCGFDSEQKSRIFERFEQATLRTHSKYGGSGLGLFISREMIELQGGKIGVFSEPGNGATFAFYIAASTTEPDHRTNGVEMALRPQNSNGDDPKYSILVVEDNLVNQKVLRLQLQKLGHTVHVASHGGEALEFLETTSCWTNNATSDIDLSVILMDLEMPIMNGIEATAKIREAQAAGTLNKHIPIISVSANARDAHVQEALECGMDGAISKPFKMADLMPRIEKLVKGG